MGWLKRDLIRKAFSAAGLASYDFDLSADQIQDGLSSLDAMMASWDAAGIHLGYPIPSTVDGGDVSQDSGLPDYANRAVFLNLALELAASVGRELSPKIATMAKRAYDVLVTLAAEPIPMKFPDTLPVGAGNKGWGGVAGPFIVDEDDDISTGLDSELDFK